MQTKIVGMESQDFQQRLAELEKDGLLRQTRMVNRTETPAVTVDGTAALLLCSNDYLGLAVHEDVRAAAAQAAYEFGAGAGASRLVCGTLPLHEQLEKALATFKQTETALLFGSGYLANTGVIAALAKHGGAVYSDELNHASIVDGCRLARAETVIYRHRDIEHLSYQLNQRKQQPAVIVTDSVFSMDGDIAPLTELAELAEQHKAKLVVDEAHATGVVGSHGEGLITTLAVNNSVTATIGTLGKAFGSYGAFVACNDLTRRYLTNVARTFIFSTALPPPVVAAAYAALQIVQREPQRIEKLQHNSQLLRSELKQKTEKMSTIEKSIPIVPLIVGDAEKTMSACDAALAQGVFCQAIRPPTVPVGTSRLRATVMATHSKQEIREAATVLKKCVTTFP